MKYKRIIAITGTVLCVSVLLFSLFPSVSVTAGMASPSILPAESYTFDDYTGINVSLTENFDGQIAGNEPDDVWYTFNNSEEPSYALVTDSMNYSSPHSLHLNGTGTATFVLNESMLFNNISMKVFIPYDGMFTCGLYNGDSFIGYFSLYDASSYVGNDTIVIDVGYGDFGVFANLTNRWLNVTISFDWPAQQFYCSVNEHTVSSNFTAYVNALDRLRFSSGGYSDDAFFDDLSFSCQSLSYPSASWFDYWGTYAMDNNTMYDTSTHFGTSFNTWFDDYSLSMVGEGFAQFNLTEPDLFSMDYKLLHLLGDLRLDFLNGSDIVGSYIFEERHDPDAYVESLDFNDDGEVNFADVQALLDVYGQTGTPGWIKQDIVTDGVIDYLDVSVFVGMYTSHISQWYDIFFLPAFDQFDESVQPYLEAFYNGTDPLLWHTYHHSQLVSDQTDWLHFYHQFDTLFYDSDELPILTDPLNYTWVNYTSKALASAFSMTKNNVNRAPWNTIGDTFEYSMKLLPSNFSAIRFTGYDGTVAFLDDFISCLTPYNMTITPYPANDTVDIPREFVYSVTPSFPESMTPLFVTHLYFNQLSPIGSQIASQRLLVHDSTVSASYFTDCSSYDDYGFDTCISYDISFICSVADFWGSNHNYYDNAPVWEFPQGTDGHPAWGDRRAYGFTTESYHPPTVSNLSLAHEAVDVHYPVTASFNISSPHTDGVRVTLYAYIDGSWHSWGSYGDVSEFEAELSSGNFAHEPLTTYHWRFTAWDGYYTSYYPTPAQSSWFMGGYRVFNFTTADDEPPYFSSYSPPDSSVFDMSADSFSFNATNNETWQNLQLDMWFTLEFESIDGMIENRIWAIENNVLRNLWRERLASWSGNNLSVTLTAELMRAMLSEFHPATQSNLTLEIRIIDGDYNAPVWLNLTYEIDYSGLYAEFEVITPRQINYYTSQWNDESSFTFRITNDQGTTHGLYYSMMRYEDGTWVSLTSMYTESSLSNGTHSFPLWKLVPFSDMQYRLVFSLYPEGEYVSPSYSIDFSLGNAPGTERKLAVRIVDDTLYYATNEFYDDTHMLGLFIYRDDAIDRVITLPGNFYTSDGSAWHSYDLSFLSAYSEYHISVGYLRNRHAQGNYQQFNAPFPQIGTQTYETHELYSNDFESLEWIATHDSYSRVLFQFWYAPTWYGYAVESQQYHFTGATTSYEHLPAPPIRSFELGQYVGFVEGLGIQNFGAILAMIIIGLFMVIPFVLMKGKSYDVPLIVILVLGFTGFIVSIGFGLVELWLLSIPLFLVMFFLIFRGVAYVWGRTSVDSGGQGQQTDEGVEK